ncbi:ataxin-10 [Ictalurus furcatus]|uniref:ataxin-10 n=1 Tax=Ictalurus furcatus TaxID=66913 RepID=UPI00235074FA|nr:ataxin-10 [Ictalurus furcatus]
MFSLNSVMDEICADRLTVQHLSSLQSVTKALRDEQFRCGVETEVLHSLSALLSRLSDKLLEDDEAQTAPLCLQLTAECFRAQRNACVQCPHNQRILRDQGCIQVSLGILGKLLTLTPGASDHRLDALRCGIQFLGNAAVGNQLCKDDIWACGFPHMFLDLLELNDEKAVAYMCMVIYTCLDTEKTEQLGVDPIKLKVALKITELCRTLPDIDWTVLIVTQHFFKSSELTEKMYSEMSDHERLTLLELVITQLGEVKEEDCVIPLRTAQFFTLSFQHSCKAVLTLSSVSSADEQALVVIRLLDILCDMTSGKRKFMDLQNHPDLLQTTIELLKEVHFLGKASKNIFSAAQDFSLTSSDKVGTHPALSFKAHLIRLIGNLCHGHTANQNQVRELDGIALILDNCSIDSNNPFISQWAVFAIRNILEHNVENQRLVQGLRRQGVADDSILRELGFCVQERDGNLLLRPLKKEKEQREH